MPLFSQPEEDSNHLRALVREQGQPLPHPSQQQFFPDRPDIDTRNCAFVSGTFRHLDHVSIAANQGGPHFLVEGKSDDDDNANQLATITKTKGEYLRTILKWVLKQEFWERNSAPAGDARNVLNVFVEEQKSTIDSIYVLRSRQPTLNYGQYNQEDSSLALELVIYQWQISVSNWAIYFVGSLRELMEDNTNSVSSSDPYIHPICVLVVIT